MSGTKGNHDEVLNKATRINRKYPERYHGFYGKFVMEGANLQKQKLKEEYGSGGESSDSDYSDDQATSFYQGFRKIALPDASLGDKLWISVFGRLFNSSTNSFDVVGFEPKKFLLAANRAWINKLWTHSDELAHSSSIRDLWRSSVRHFYLIHLVVQLRDIGLVEHLLKQGADINAIMISEDFKENKYVDLDNRRIAPESQDYRRETKIFSTPLDLATENAQQDMIDFLTLKNAFTQEEILAVKEASTGITNSM